MGKFVHAQRIRYILYLGIIIQFIMTIDLNNNFIDLIIIEISHRVLPFPANL